eukprot:PhF_6_TR4840/c0_g1_i1/m.6743/K01354/ptrB; oligopeptidase B
MFRIYGHRKLSLSFRQKGHLIPHTNFFVTNHRKTTTSSMNTNTNLGPIAPLRPHNVYFGKVEGENRGDNPMDPPLVREDPYFWLRDDKRENPEVLNHLREENKFTEEKTSHLADLRKQLYDEHISHLKETDMSAPYRSNQFYYFDRTIKGLSYNIRCRVPISATPNGAPPVCSDEPIPGEEVVLDINKLAVGKSQCDVKSIKQEPKNHAYYAYSVDFKGDEVYSIYLSSNPQDAPPILTNTTGRVDWDTQGKFLLYVTKDQAKRSDKIWLHEMGTKQEDDICLLHEPEEIFDVGTAKSRCGRFWHLSIESSETTENYFIDLYQLEKTTSKEEIPKLLTLIRKREKGHRYNVEMHQDGRMFIMTNEDKCLNNKVLLGNVAEISKPWKDLQVLIAHDPSRKIDSFEAFRDFAVIEGREDGLSQCYVMSLNKGNTYTFERLKMKEPVYTIEISSFNAVFDSPCVRLAYSSPTTPMLWYEHYPAEGKDVPVKQKPIPCYDPQLYVCERWTAPSIDGVEISMSAVHLKSLDMTKPHPTMLYGYGSYGICIEPEFKESILPYLQRGVIHVTAHIRGGGENGRAWYEKYGKYFTKRNTFHDFISCAEFLIAKGYTTPAMLATEGRSAGGLLMGAIMNMRPDLFSVVVAGVPFVDVMTTMCDASIPLTTGEWEEWGNPNEIKYFDYMLSYSPIDNVRPQFYPHVLIVAGLHDPRVAYWEPTKWACKLRAVKRDTNDVLLKMDMDVGHFSASDRYKFWREKAFEQAYVLWRIGAVSL